MTSQYTPSPLDSGKNLASVRSVSSRRWDSTDDFVYWAKEYGKANAFIIPSAVIFGSLFLNYLKKEKVKTNLLLERIEAACKATLGSGSGQTNDDRDVA